MSWRKRAQAFNQALVERKLVAREPELFKEYTCIVLQQTVLVGLESQDFGALSHLHFAESPSNSDWVDYGVFLNHQANYAPQFVELMRTWFMPELVLSRLTKERE